MMSPKQNVLAKVFDLIDIFVEAYLGSAVKPFLTYHDKFYDLLNKTLRSVLNTNRSKIADWFTANFITYFRTFLAIPCLLLLAWGHNLLPSIIVIFVEFGGVLEGVVAHFWVDVKKELETTAMTSASNDETSSPSPANSDDESFGTWNFAHRSLFLLKSSFWFLFPRFAHRWSCYNI
jgi:hypothetical protein